MAAGPFTVFNKAKREIAAGTFSQDKTFRAMLTTNAQPLTAAFAGDVAGLTAEVTNGNGYTSGGQVLTNVAYTGDAGTVKFDADNVLWGGTPTITAKYVVVYVGTKPLGFMDLETTIPAGPTSTGGPFEVKWHETNGLFTFS